jgi:signal transduction histidine kinase
MSQEGFVIRRIFLLWAALILAAATGCAPVQIKSTGAQAETTSADAGEEEMLKVVTQQEYLQAMLMGFADTFATKFAEATTRLILQEPGPERAHAANHRFYVLAAAIDIASSRYPGLGIIDMVILVTLERIVWEDFWQPELYGDSAQVVIKTLKNSEEDVWAMASKVFTSKQLEELRALIYEWRKKNPDQVSINFIRIDNILELSDLGSLLQKETRPGGLFAPVTEVTRAVDQVRFTAERAMYRLSRMQATLGLQISMVYHNLAAQHEVRQVLSDITGFREVAERLPGQISEERRKIVRDLESQEKTIRNVVGDIRGMMKEGNDLISLVSETTKSVDILSEKIDTMLRTPRGVRPFDIMDYQNTVLAASDAVRQANSLLDSVDNLLASPNWEQKMPVMLKLTDGVASESKGVITHAFVLGFALIIIFSVAMLVLIRYAARQFAGLRKEQGTA